MINLEMRDDIQPICPHCAKELRTLWMHILRGILGKRYIYFCPDCHKVLGVSHRKGFWMG